MCSGIRSKAVNVDPEASYSGPILRVSTDNLAINAHLAIWAEETKLGDVMLAT